MIIGRLRGTVAAIGADSIMVDVNGVGYVTLAGSGLLSKLTVPPFPGGQALRSPIMTLAMTWFAMRDRIGL